MKYREIFNHYLDPMVMKEIYDYSVNRWVAAESQKNGRRIFIRYWWRNGPPLEFHGTSSIKKFFYRFRRLNPRTIYASINIYKKLSDRHDATDVDNIVFSTPIWDVDGTVSQYHYVIEAAKIIVDELEKYDVDRSVYLIWSGRGVHIHINEKAFSPSILKKYHPLNISYSIVEYIIRCVRKRLLDLFENVRGGEREFKVENKIDVQRVFTVPLSLHREIDLVAICFKPDDIDNFDISWADPKKFRHDKEWRKYDEGEADYLAEKAVKEIGEYISKLRLPEKKGGSVIKSFLNKTPSIIGHIGRFQVMALLQAARYYLLKGDIDKAMSFGLNRAIFYAWAKHTKVRYSKRRFAGGGELRYPEEYKPESIGDERAFVSSDGLFIIGDNVQRPENYKRQIANKINPVISYDIAWKAALNYLKHFPQPILLSQKDFYEKAYLPIRDGFEKIVQEYISTTNYEKLRGDEN